MERWVYQKTGEGNGPLDLTKCRYHKMGGWLTAFLLLLCIQGVSCLGASARIALALIRNPGPVPDGVWAYCGLYLLPALLAAAALLLLFLRKRAFRIVYACYAAIWVAGCLLAAFRSDADRIAYIGSGLMMALWTVYLFCSDRVRVYCGMQPKRPVPMPAPPLEQPHWNEDGTVYTDEKGNEINFRRNHPCSTLICKSRPASYSARTPIRRSVR